MRSLERLSARYDFTGPVEHNAGAIEDQAVIATDLVHHHNRNAIIAGNGSEHLAAELALAYPEGRRRDIQNKVASSFDQLVHRIKPVELAVPEVLVVPRILANGESHAVATEIEQLLRICRGEVAHLIEDVVGGKQHLGLDEINFAVAQQGRRIHHGFAGFGACLGHQAANYRDAASVSGDLFCYLLITGLEGRALHEVTWRISADGKLRKQDEARSGASSAL